MEKIKIKGLVTLICCVVVIFFNESAVFPKQIVLESNSQFSFAREYMAKGEYGRAVEEFERFIHFFPEDPEVLRARCLIGICYLNDHKYDAARESLSEIIKTNPDSPFAGRALLLTGESYYQEGLIREAEYYFQLVMDEYDNSDLAYTARYRLGWTKLKESRWRDASSIFEKTEYSSPFYDSSRLVAQKCLEGEALPYKTPALAGSLAAVIPGLGHAYVSRYKDAAVAFVLNGLFIWAAIESFDHDHDVLGGILSFLEVGWYSGNIYSAVNVTHKYNRKIESDFRRGMKDQFDINLFATGKGNIGLALTYRF